MEHRNINRTVVPPGEVRWKKILRIGLSTVAALFFSLPSVFASSHAAGLDEQSAPAQDPQTQQSATTSGPASQPDTPTLSMPVPKVKAPVEKKPISAVGQQTSRMFWIVPNFAAVSADTLLPPLSTGDKFVLATKDSVDYSAFVWTGLVAAQSMALNSYPELHQGMKGYSRYYWRAFADQASGSFFTEAIVPAITHEDPRYYTRGHGGFFHRTAYALSRVVITKSDSGSTRPNISELGGNALEAGLANLYYPPQERSFHNTTINWATQLEAAGLNNIFREFWPDIRRKVFRQQ